MKTIQWLFIALIATAVASCGKEADLNPNSIFESEGIEAVQNEFDVWLYNNYTKPYNIEMKYRFDDKESDTQYNLTPADYNKSVALAKLTKYLWLEAYEELTGEEFIRIYCPKIFFLVGSVGYQQGSEVLGTAEGGLKITLYNVNGIDMDDLDMDMLNYYFFHTMHHEFAHILHQTKNYPTDFNLISASDYQSTSWVNLTLGEALQMGFISEYASSETQEDFVELISIYVTSTPEYWDFLLSYAGNGGAPGKAIINQKLEMVKEYLATSWEIDLDALRDIVQRRTNDIPTLDLTTLN
jgi:substrate import-associated zinc metallohydrolase lipoprotein